MSHHKIIVLINDVGLSIGLFVVFSFKVYVYDIVFSLYNSLLLLLLFDNQDVFWLFFITFFDSTILLIPAIVTHETIIAHISTA